MRLGTKSNHNKLRKQKSNGLYIPKKYVSSFPPFTAGSFNLWFSFQMVLDVIVRSFTFMQPTPYFGAEDH